MLIAPQPAGVPCEYRVRDWMDGSDLWCPGEIVEEMEQHGQRYLRVRSGREYAWRNAEHVRVAS